MTAKELIDLFDSKNGTRVLPIFNYVSEHYPTFNHHEIDLGDELFKALTELDELKRDVARYFGLQNMWNWKQRKEWTKELDNEYGILRDKLMKVGK